jgi:hypothetical protein
MTASITETPCIGSRVQIAVSRAYSLLVHLFDTPRRSLLQGFYE